MIIGKEALVNIERMFKSQYQVYSDADLGIEVTEDEINHLRSNLKTLKGIYSGTNIYPTPDSSGVADIMIPIEKYSATCTRCTVIQVIVSRETPNKAFIQIINAVIEDNKIPFLNK